MMGDEPLLVDTSVLLEATDAGRRNHRSARKLIEQRQRLVFPAQVVREYLVVATRPVEVNGLGLSVQDALLNVEELRRLIRLLPEEKPLLKTLLDLLGKAPCRGKQVHDLHIIAAALVHKVPSIVTLNPRDFAPYAFAVTVVGPREGMGL
jgi:predicted nucleic acid-binding protein